MMEVLSVASVMALRALLSVGEQSASAHLDHGELAPNLVSDRGRIWRRDRRRLRLVSLLVGDLGIDLFEHDGRHGCLRVLHQAVNVSRPDSSALAPTSTLRLAPDGADSARPPGPNCTPAP